MLLKKKISISYFIAQIRPDLILIVVYAIIIGILDHVTTMRSIRISLSVSSTLGTAIALLLAFRTNQSYERWWEARAIWGAIVNDSRTIVRQAKNFIAPESRNISTAIAERQKIWAFALGQYLRKIPFSAEVQEYLAANNISGENIPNMLLSKHSEDIQHALHTGAINPYQHVQLDATIVRLCDALGKCERIKNTVFPRSYSLLIHFIIYVFATILPFGLIEEGIVVEILLTIAVPTIFIAIEKTSILMQDPFENQPLDVPMTALAQTISRNIEEMSGGKLSPVLENDRYYQL